MFFEDLNDVLEEFVLIGLKASPLTKPLLTLDGWHEENVYTEMFHWV